MQSRTFPFQTAVANYQVPVPIPATLVLEKFEGYLDGTAPAYLQIHDLLAANLSSGVSIPIRSLQLLANTGFLWQYIDDNFTLPALANGLLFTLSSTNEVFTTYAGGNMELSVTLEDWEMETVNKMTSQSGNTQDGTVVPIAPTVVGDLTTLIKSRVIWAGGINELLKLECSNAVGATTTRIQIFAHIAANNDKPLLGQDYPITAGDTLTLNFGNNSGFHPMRQTAAYALNTLCVVKASTTAGVLTAPAGNDITVRGTYLPE